MKSILIRWTVIKRVWPALCIVFKITMLYSLRNRSHRSTCHAVVLSVPRVESLRRPICYSSLLNSGSRWHHCKLSERVSSVRLRSLWSLLSLLTFLSIEIQRISRSATESDDDIVILCLWSTLTKWINKNIISESRYGSLIISLSGKSICHFSRYRIEDTAKEHRRHDTDTLPLYPVSRAIQYRLQRSCLREYYEWSSLNSYYSRSKIWKKYSIRERRVMISFFISTTYVKKNIHESRRVQIDSDDIKCRTGRFHRSSIFIVSEARKSILIRDFIEDDVEGKYFMKRFIFLLLREFDFLFYRN